jgi:Zn-dependent protease with chaperone function
MIAEVEPGQDSAPSLGEHADLFLAVLILAAAGAVGSLVGALVAIGNSGALGLLGLLIGDLSACYKFAAATLALPPAVLLLIVVVVVSAFAGAGALLRLWREQRLLARLPRAPADDVGFVSLAGLDANVPIEVVPSPTASAFCSGVLRPRVLITAGLLERLSAEEQVAAVVHELEHARARGPLKVASARAVARTFFWLPALGDLLDRYVLLCELAADRAAISRTSRSALAGALVEVIQSRSPAGALGMADFAAIRIDRLFDRGVPLPRLFRRRSVVAAAFAIAMGISLALSPPALAGAQSAQLHSMSTALLVHHAGPRLLGLLAVLGVIVGGRRLVARWI